MKTSGLEYEALAGTPTTPALRIDSGYPMWPLTHLYEYQQWISNVAPHMYYLPCIRRGVCYREGVVQGRSA